ncbi:hypothetical protein DSECCO2_661330 [anaerobic digester metagenome]
MCNDGVNDFTLFTLNHRIWGECFANSAGDKSVFCIGYQAFRVLSHGLLNLFDLPVNFFDYFLMIGQCLRHHFGSTILFE